MSVTLMVLSQVLPISIQRAGSPGGSGGRRVLPATPAAVGRSSGRSRPAAGGATLPAVLAPPYAAPARPHTGNRMPCRGAPPRPGRLAGRACILCRLEAAEGAPCRSCCTAAARPRRAPSCHLHSALEGQGNKCYSYYYDHNDVIHFIFFSLIA